MASILIVDDEPTLRQLLRTVLERAGYEVAEADNGNEAMGIIRAIELDLVITDIFMPENDGFELIQHLRRAAPGVKIITISGETPGPYLTTARLLGADAVLGKPVSPEVLVDGVAHLIGKPNTS